MSTGQTLALGAVAGFTIFLGLPLGRVQSADRRLQAGLSALACGILALPALGRPRARRRARRGGARGGRRGRGLVGRVRRLRGPARRRSHRRPHEPRLLRPVDEATAQLDARRARRGGDRRVRLAAVDRPSFARAPAGAPDRGRDRPAQLRRGARHRPGRRGRRDQPRARAHHRLRPAQRHRGVRHRRPHVRERSSGRAGASSGFSA